MSRGHPPHPLHPLAGLHLGHAHVTPNDLVAAALARPVWGPGALLADLEVRVARPVVREEPLARLSAYRLALAAIDVGVFAASLRIDPWGTTRTIVAMHDALVQGGWDGRPINNTGARIAVVSRLGAGLPGGVGERLSAVTRALTHAPYDRLTLAEPEHLWTAAWRGLFQRLRALGSTIDTLLAPTPCAPDTTDLGALQRFIAAGAGAGAARPSLRGDGTVALLQGETVEALADALASELAQLAPETRAAVVRSSDYAALEAALAAHGLPRLGGVRARAAATAAAWLPLILRLTQPTFDPEAAIDLLLLPDHGLSRYHTDRLASALAAAPGLGSEGWKRAAPAAAEAHPDELARLVRWLTPTPSLQADELARRLHALDSLLRARGLVRQRPQEVDLAADAFELARHTLEAVLRVLPSEGPIDAAPIDALLALLAEHAAVATTRLEAGTLLRADAPEAMLAPVDMLVWWGFVESSRPSCLFRPSEARALAAVGIAIEDPGDALRAHAEAARNLVLRARERVILALPERLAGERQTAHALWSELLGRLGLEEEDANALFLRRPNDLAKARPGHVAAVPPRMRPPATGSWQVPVGALAPAPGAPMTLSVTNLERLLSCPLRQVLAVDLQLRTRATGALQTGPLLLGRVGHTLVERLHRAGLLAEANPAAVDEVLEQVLADEAAHLLRPGRAALKRHYVRVYQQCVAALAKLLRERGLTVTGAEDKSELPLDGGVVTLRTDLRAHDASGRVTVIDLKWSTSSHKKALFEGRAIQLAAYVKALAGPDGVAADGFYFGITRGDVASAPRPDVLDEIWRRVERTLPVLRAMLASGTIPVSGLVSAPTLGETLGLKAADALPSDRSNGESGACRYCEYGVVCGARWEGS